MTQTPATPSTTIVLAIHFEGAAKPLSQVKATVVGKAISKALAGQMVAACHRVPGPADAAEVLVDAPGIPLRELREAWAKGLLRNHQGVDATRLHVFEASADLVPLSTQELTQQARQIVALSRG